MFYDYPSPLHSLLPSHFLILPSPLSSSHFTLSLSLSSLLFPVPFPSPFLPLFLLPSFPSPTISRLPYSCFSTLCSLYPHLSIPAPPSLLFPSFYPLHSLPPTSLPPSPSHLPSFLSLSFPLSPSAPPPLFSLSHSFSHPFSFSFYTLFLASLSLASLPFVLSIPISSISSFLSFSPSSLPSSHSSFSNIPSQFDDSVYLAVSQDEEDTEESLTRKLFVFNRIVTLLYGPVDSK